MKTNKTTPLDPNQQISKDDLKRFVKTLVNDPQDLIHYLFAIDDDIITSIQQIYDYNTEA